MKNSDKYQLEIHSEWDEETATTFEAEKMAGVEVIAAHLARAVKSGLQSGHYELGDDGSVGRERGACAHEGERKKG